MLTTRRVLDERRYEIVTLHEGRVDYFPTEGAAHERSLPDIPVKGLWVVRLRIEVGECPAERLPRGRSD